MVAFVPLQDTFSLSSKIFLDPHSSSILSGFDPGCLIFLVCLLGFYCFFYFGCFFFNLWNCEIEGIRFVGLGVLILWEL